MPLVRSDMVRGQDGWCGTVLPPAPHTRSDPTHVRVQLASGEPTHAVMPVLVEELDVQKRLVETGTVRLIKVVHERETLVDEPLWREEVEVTRVPIQRVVDAPIPVREEHGTLIVPVLEEVLVVEKRLMLQEEIHIRTHRVETRQPQQVTLRSEEVGVERVLNPETSAITQEGG